MYYGESLTYLKSPANPDVFWYHLCSMGTQKKIHPNNICSIYSGFSTGSCSSTLLFIVSMSFHFWVKNDLPVSLGITEKLFLTNLFSLQFWHLIFLFLLLFVKLYFLHHIVNSLDVHIFISHCLKSVLPTISRIKSVIYVLCQFKWEFFW